MVACTPSENDWDALLWIKWLKVSLLWIETLQHSGGKCLLHLGLIDLNNANLLLADFLQPC